MCIYVYAERERDVIWEDLWRWDKKREDGEWIIWKFIASDIKMAEKTHWKLLDNKLVVDRERDNNRGKKVIKIKTEINEI
jgi:hypothetical protein